MSNPIYKLGNTSYSLFRDLTDNDKTILRNNDINVVELSGVTSENVLNINHENPIIDIRSINTGITAHSTLNLGITASDVWNISAGISGTEADPGYNLHIGKNNAEFITILENGNVGIATTNPTYKLSVSDSAEVIGDFFVSGNIFISGATGFADIKNIWHVDGSNNVLSDAYSGNYGIGTSTPSNKFEVIGGIGVSGNIVPLLDNTFDLGSTTQRFKDLYLDGNTIYIGDAQISESTSTITVSNDFIIGGSLSITGGVDFGDNLTITGTLDVGGSAQLNTLGVTTTANITGDTTLSTMTATGAVQVNSLGSTGDVNTLTDYNIGGIQVLSSNTLGTGITNSSLQNLGIQSSNLDMGTNDITNATSITATNLTGTLQTAIQTNITSVGTLTSLIVTGDSTFDTNTLFVDASVNNVGIGTTTPLTSLHISATDALVIPVGTTSERVDVQGGIRYNTQLSSFEGYSGSAWGSLGGLTDVDGDTFISAEDSPGSNNNELKFTTGGTQQMIIGSNGFIGIGTTNPGINLAIVDTDTGLDHISTDNLAIKTGGTQRLLCDENGNVAFGSFTNPLFIITIGDADTGIDWVSDGVIRIMTDNSERMRFDAGTNGDISMLDTGDGNLGIGIATPVRNVHIHESTASTAAFIHLTNDVTGSGTGQGFDMIVDTAGNAELRNREATNMEFFTNNTQQWAITSGGNLIESNNGYVLGKQIFGSIGFETDTTEGTNNNENISGDQRLFLSFTRVTNVIPKLPTEYDFYRNFNHNNGFEDATIDNGTNANAPDEMQRLEVNTTGLYLVTYEVDIDGISSTSAIITTKIELSGSGDYGRQSCYTGTGTIMRLSGSAIINATSSQYFDIRLTISTGTCDINGGRLDALLVSSTI